MKNLLLKVLRVFAAVVVLALAIATVRSGVFVAEKPAPAPIHADGKPIPTCGPGDPRCPGQ